MVHAGKAKAIGISNFDKAQMEHLLKNTSIIPAVHQMEVHPWLQQREFTEWNRAQGIHITQYSPFGNLNPIYGAGNLGRLIDEPVLKDIGKDHDKSGSQVCLGKDPNKTNMILVLTTTTT